MTGKSFIVLKNRLGTREIENVSERMLPVATVQTDDVEFHGYLERETHRDYTLVGCVHARHKIWQRIKIDRRRVRTFKRMAA